MYIDLLIGFHIVPIQSDLSFIQSIGGYITNIFRYVNAISVRLDESTINYLINNLPNIRYIEPDDTIYTSILSTSTRLQSTLTQQIPWGIAKIRSPQVHSTGNKGTGIKIGVIDTGIDYNHEDLKVNYKGGYNFINNTNNPMDDHGHGTHVTGIIAATDNNIGIIGVAPEASIYSLKVLDTNGSGKKSNVVAAIEWAIDNHMQIVNISLGGSYDSSTQTLHDIVDKAYNTGILIIAAAGNWDPSPTCAENGVNYPANFDSVIAISSVDSTDNIYISNTGPQIELCAPGKDILSTVPIGSCSGCDPSGYKNEWGTSMACPHVTGTAALVLKANPNLTNVQVRQILQRSTIHLGSSGRNGCYGFGRIDALLAIQNSSGGCIIPTCTFGIS